jgi:general secretion pathway protein G
MRYLMRVDARKRGAFGCVDFGFTLLELLVVMVVVGLLASYVAPRYFDQIGKSETKTARAQIEALGQALDAYRIDVGHYPNTEQGLQALVGRPPQEERWAGPYLQKSLPPDPWGWAYQYRSPGEASREYEVISWGRDGRPGGEGDASDVTSWQTGR